jgi:hypothetical protein
MGGTPIRVFGISPVAILAGYRPMDRIIFEKGFIYEDLPSVSNETLAPDPRSFSNSRTEPISLRGAVWQETQWLSPASDQPSGLPWKKKRAAMKIAIRRTRYFDSFRQFLPKHCSQTQVLQA